MSLLSCNCFWLLPEHDVDDEPRVVEPPDRNHVDFDFDATCELSGPLTVEIGQGDDRFRNLSDGNRPRLYSEGGFQGSGGSSQHYYLAYRVGGVDLDSYDELLIEVETYAAGECPDDGQPCGMSDWGHSRVIGGPYEPLETEDGWVEQIGVFMPYYDQVMVQVTAIDPCGRVGWVQHRW